MYKKLSLQSGNPLDVKKEIRTVFIQNVLKLFKTFEGKSAARSKFDFPLKKIVYNPFYKKSTEKKKLKGITVFKAAAIKSRWWKKINANDKEMKKYSDLNKAEKQKYEKDLQRYKEDHIDEVKIMNPHKRCNKTGTKAG